MILSQHLTSNMLNSVGTALGRWDIWAGFASGPYLNLLRWWPLSPAWLRALHILTPSALKVASNEVIACFTTLLSKCMLTHGGHAGVLGKRCAVTPVHKSESLQSADNYRSIAIGMLLAKVYAAVLSSVSLNTWKLTICGRKGKLGSGATIAVRTRCDSVHSTRCSA